MDGAEQIPILSRCSRSSRDGGWGCMWPTGPLLGSGFQAGDVGPRPLPPEFALPQFIHPDWTFLLIHTGPDSLAFPRQGRTHTLNEGTDSGHTHWPKEEFNHSWRVGVIRLKWSPVPAAPTRPRPLHKTALIFIVGKGWHASDL